MPDPSPTLTPAQEKALVALVTAGQARWSAWPCASIATARALIRKGMAVEVGGVWKPTPAAGRWLAEHGHG